jgi:DNA primase
VEKIEDTRLEKRKYVIEKAKSLLKEMINNVIPESKEISQLVRDEVKAMGVIEYGEDKLVAGVGVPSSDSIILVEGRADVINLLKHNINNALAIGGAKIPKSLVKISKEKEVTLFIDGDRGGEIILQQLVQAGVDIDYVARAPAGKEVEELTRKEIIKALRNKVPFVKKEERSVKRTDSGSVEEALKERLKSVKNTYKALYLDENLNVVGESAVRDLIRRLKDSEGVSYVVFDGIITQRIVDLAKERNLRGVAGLKMGHVNKRNVDITLVVE